LLGYLPHAALAAIVIYYSVGLIQPREFLAIRKVRAMEFHWALAAAGGVLLFGTLQGITVAIVVSMVSLAYQTARPHVYVIGRKRGTDVLRPVSSEHPDDETFEGLLILRPEGRIFFLNAEYVKEQALALEAQYQPRVIAWDMSAVPDLEYSALQALMDGEKRLSELGVALWMTGLNPGVLEVVRHAGFDQRLGRERMLFNAQAAIERYQALEAVRGGGAQPGVP
jgi:MFS superfamily sulfate permease-like transporter